DALRAGTARGRRGPVGRGPARAGGGASTRSERLPVPGPSRRTGRGPALQRALAADGARGGRRLAGRPGAAAPARLGLERDPPRRLAASPTGAGGARRRT